VALLIQGQLLTQKEVLRGEGGTGAQAQEQETHRIHEEYQQRACEPDEEAEQAWESSHSQGTPPNYRSLSLPIVAAEGRNVQSDEDGIFAEHRGTPTIHGSEKGSGLCDTNRNMFCYNSLIFSVITAVPLCRHCIILNFP
jgi:hypothetical protein